MRIQGRVLDERPCDEDYSRHNDPIDEQKTICIIFFNVEYISKIIQKKKVWTEQDDNKNNTRLPNRTDIQDQDQRTDRTKYQQTTSKDEEEDL